MSKRTIELRPTCFKCPKVIRKTIADGDGWICTCCKRQLGDATTVDLPYELESIYGAHVGPGGMRVAEILPDMAHFISLYPSEDSKKDNRVRKHGKQVLFVPNEDQRSSLESQLDWFHYNTSLGHPRNFPADDPKLVKERMKGIPKIVEDAVSIFLNDGFNIHHVSNGTTPECGDIRFTGKSWTELTFGEHEIRTVVEGRIMWDYNDPHRIHHVDFDFQKFLRNLAAKTGYRSQYLLPENSPGSPD